MDAPLPPSIIAAASPSGAIMLRPMRNPFVAEPINDPSLPHALSVPIAVDLTAVGNASAQGRDVSIHTNKQIYLSKRLKLGTVSSLSPSTSVTV